MRTVIYVKPDSVDHISPQLGKLFDEDADNDVTIGVGSTDKQIVQFGDALVESTADGVAFIFDGPLMELPVMLGNDNVEVIRVRISDEGHCYDAEIGEYKSNDNQAWAAVDDFQTHDSAGRRLPLNHKRLVVWGKTLMDARNLFYRFMLGDIEVLRRYPPRKHLPAQP